MVNLSVSDPQPRDEHHGLRWGLLGTAHISRRLIPAMRGAARSSLEAVASRDYTRAVEYARQWAIPRVLDGYATLIDSDAVDAVYIPLPNSLHVEWAVRAMEAGKHVLCEKPLALSAADVERLAGVARRERRTIAEAFMFRHEPLTRRVVELVHQEAIGAIVHVSGGFSYQQSRAYDVRLDPELGGGSLWDIGCYPVNYARLVFGTEPVEAMGTARRGVTGVDDSFTGLLRFPTGTATVFSSFRAAPRTWMELHGSEGLLRVPNPFRPGPEEVVELVRGGQATRIPVPGSRELFVAQIEDFVGAVLDGTPPAVSLSDSRGNAAALDALYRSAARGAPEAIYP